MEKLFLLPKTFQVFRQFQNPLGLLGIKEKPFHIFGGLPQIAFGGLRLQKSDQFPTILDCNPLFLENFPVRFNVFLAQKPDQIVKIPPFLVWPENKRDDFLRKKRFQGVGDYVKAFAVRENLP